MTKRKFLRITIDKSEVLLEVSVIPSGTLNTDEPANCPCCKARLAVLSEFIQWGFLEDKYTLLFACVACGKAYWYSFSLSLIELAEGVDKNVNQG